jgi:23S rRNA (adenine2503-C2)-methyltransferase
MLMQDIRSLTKDEIIAWVKDAQLPDFRARQIFDWLWKKGAMNFEEMSDLPLTLREKLKESFDFKRSRVIAEQVSSDGTIKVAISLFDGNIVEGVLIPSGKRMTACVSSQVGCSLNCKFCATGYLERKRNLDAGEIVDQVRVLNDMALRMYERGLSNIVYMGMGEPLLNYKNVVRSVRLISSTDGMGMSPQRITISTAGIAKMINTLADEDLGVQLALSLHAADDVSRTALMPINESNPLDMLAASMLYFYEKSGNRPTLEYTVIRGVNDSREQALQLSDFARRFPSKINLIEYNPIAEAEYRNADVRAIYRFAEVLEGLKHIVNIRRSRGGDIDAACGQLANKLNK